MQLGENASKPQGETWGGGGETPIRIKEEYKLQEDRIQGSTRKKERKNKQTNNQTKKRSRDKVQRD
jgi:hypothetical protein